MTETVNAVALYNGVLTKWECVGDQAILTKSRRDCLGPRKQFNVTVSSVKISPTLRKACLSEPAN